MQRKMKERKWLEKYWYLEKCWGQAHAYFAEPKQWASDFLLVSIFLKQYGIVGWTWIGVGFVAMICVGILFGHFTLKRGWLHWFQSFNNRFDPEKMEIYLNSKPQINVITSTKSKKDAKLNSNS